MYKRVLIPYDRSASSWTAAAYARVLAERWTARIELLHVARLQTEAAEAVAEIEAKAAEGDWPSDVVITVEKVAPGGVGETIARAAESIPDTIIVMATHGRGRSAAFLGSIAEEVLHQVGAPVILVGPEARAERFTTEGPIVACIDGSAASEAGLDFVAKLAGDFGVDPWVVVVAPPDVDQTYDRLAANYATRVARHLQADEDLTVQFEVLHDSQPATAAARFAWDVDASLLAAVTHARSGLHRLVEGSVTMELLQIAPVPVVVEIADGSG